MEVSPIISFVLTIVVVALVRTRRRLQHIPGPFFASLTNIVRWNWVITGRAHLIHTQLHRKYGKVVRIGPNTVLVSDPAAIPSIYRFNEPYQKSDFYDALMPYAYGKRIPDIFATRDEHIHRTMRQPIAALYSMSNLLSFEPYIKSTIEYFFSQLDELYVSTGGTCKFSHWLHLFASDVTGEMTFSRRLGFLETGTDMEGVMESNWRFFVKAAPTTQMPWLDYFYKRNPLLPARAKPNLVMAFGVARILERLQLSENTPDRINIRDFLSRFITATEVNGSLPADAVATWVNSNIQAGNDTTAILQSAIFYHLLKNPSSLAKLRLEIDDAFARGRLSEIATWKETRNLPYLDACVKEAARIHPPISLPLERIVSESGAEIAGVYMTGGTTIAMNPWAVHRDTDTFGDDAEIWRPERWLCGKERAKTLYSSLLTFGAGHRCCLGKNISYLEIYKLVPSVLQRYDIELVDPETEWHLENRWFVMPSRFYVKLRRRTDNRRPGSILYI
ncbi:cytochrome P450 [Aspergillus stella-maris]|uniref:cytochrome P450 n=1 Tax=Aspergillus stella-maris TaxID=1810926 RepID=UPI003CCCD3E6